jgi:pyrroloquinoline-quinone synthase
MSQATMQSSSGRSEHASAYSVPVTGNEAIEQAQHLFQDRLSNHPFLIACRAGTATRKQLNSLLIQHALYGEHFTRFLTALMSNLHTGDDCLRLAENLAEEVGLSEDSPTPHSRLYRQMMTELDVDRASESVTAETQNLIDTMYMLCRQTDPASGLGALCLGAEAIVPVYYTDIVKGFVNAGVPIEKLNFFTLHIECDDGHADTMREIMARMIGESPTAAIAMVSAGETAVNARLRMLDRIMAGTQ